MQPLRLRTNMQRGFIALMSVLIVGAMLMGVLILASTNGLLARSDALDAEFQQQARALAEGCIDTALLDLSQNYAFTQNNSVLAIGNDHCSNVSVQTISSDASSREVSIDATGEYKTAYVHAAVAATVQNTTSSNPAMPGSVPLVSVTFWHW